MGQGDESQLLVSGSRSTRSHNSKVRFGDLAEESSLTFSSLCCGSLVKKCVSLSFIFLLCVSMYVCLCDYNTYYKCNNGRPARWALAFLVACHCCLHNICILLYWVYSKWNMHACMYFDHGHGPACRRRQGFCHNDRTALDPTFVILYNEGRGWTAEKIDTAMKGRAAT